MSSKIFSENPVVQLQGFDGGGDCIIADVLVYNDQQDVADDICTLYGYCINPEKIKKTYLKYQLYGHDTEYAGYYTSHKGVRGAFEVWSFDLDELEYRE